MRVSIETIDAIVSILQLLPDDVFNEVMDELIDKIEDKILGTNSPLDDMLFIPPINLIRKRYGIVDHDDDMVINVSTKIE